MRAAYWKGVKLFEECQHFPGWARRGGSESYEGVLQTYEGANPQSPNLSRPLAVKTAVLERREQEVTGYRTGLSIENTLYAVEALLIANMATAGWLAWAENDAQKAAVTTGHAAGTAVPVTIGTPGAGWAPATGQLVCFRNPATGHGFTAALTGVAGSVISATLPETVTTDWVVVFVQRAYENASYQTMDGGAPRDESDPELDRGEVVYHFIGRGQVLVPSGSLLSGYTT